MQPMITDPSVTVRTAGFAPPQGQCPPPSPMPPPATPPRTAAPDRPEPSHVARPGPLRNGNPRGNPNLGPRCGAKAHTTGLACRAPAMPNGRCRLHGGKSTGPRTPEGLARLAAAHTTHGLYAQTGPDAGLRAEIHHVRIVARRARLNDAAYNHLPWLPEPFAARIRADTATELHAPPYPAHFQAAPAAATPKPDAPTADLPPPAHTRPRRDASGRFAPPPPQPLRGRQAERANARTEASALAPWRHAVAQARIARRQAMRTAPAPHSENSAQHPTQHPSPNARFEKPRINLMDREAPPNLPDPHAADATHTPDLAPHRQATRGPDLQFKEPARNAIQRETAPHPTEPDEAGRKNPAKTPVQRDTVARPVGPGTAGGKNPAKTPMQRGTVRPDQNPFRNALLSGTVSNSPDSHKLAATVRRAGGWPVMLAIDAAKDGGKDWRPAVAEARRRMAQDTHPQPARPSPPSPAAP
jgi:hypothetical protein